MNMVYFSQQKKWLKNWLKPLIYKGFLANGTKTIAKKDQSNDAGDAKANEIGGQALIRMC